MEQTAAILEGARLLIPHLRTLVGEEAEDVERELVEFLEQAEAGHEVDSLIVQAVARHEATRMWFVDYLREHGPVATDKVGEKSPPPVSRGTGISSPEYRCGKCGYKWYRQSVADAVPLCPHDQSPLKLVR